MEKLHPKVNKSGTNMFHGSTAYLRNILQKKTKRKNSKYSSLLAVLPWNRHDPKSYLWPIKICSRTNSGDAPVSLIHLTLISILKIKLHCQEKQRLFKFDMSIWPYVCLSLCHIITISFYFDILSWLYHFVILKN